MTACVSVYGGLVADFAESWPQSAPRSYTKRTYGSEFDVTDDGHFLMVEAIEAGELLITSIVGRRVTLSWSPPATAGTTSYELVVGSAPARSDVGTWNVGNVLTVTADHVASGTYYARVRAVNAQGHGAESNEVVVRVF